MAHACEALAHAQPSPFLPLVTPRLATPRQDPGSETAAKAPPKTFFRRPLDTGLVAFSSAEGRTVLRELLPAGSADGAEGSGSFFEMMGAYDMQQDPVSCGVASLAIALSALQLAPWRAPAAGAAPFPHVTEAEVLALIADTDHRQRVATQGITLGELGAVVAGVPGLATETVYCEEGAQGEQAFLEALEAATAGRLREAGGAALILNFSRAALGQTGSGHFSPVAAWHRARDLVLVLDTARFKYPAFWAPAARVWHALVSRDDQTQRPRGFLFLRRTERAA